MYSRTPPISSGSRFPAGLLVTGGEEEGNGARRLVGRGECLLPPRLTLLALCTLLTLLARPTEQGKPSHLGSTQAAESGRSTAGINPPFPPSQTLSVNKLNQTGERIINFMDGPHLFKCSLSVL